MLKALVLVHLFLTSEICQSLLTGEELVDILELKTFGLREEKVDDRYPCGVKHSKNNICSPTDVVDGRRSDLYDDLRIMLALLFAHMSSSGHLHNCISSWRLSTEPNRVVVGAEGGFQKDTPRQ